MEIKTQTEKLLPKLNNFNNHFQIADKAFLNNELPNIEFLNMIENSWKQIENFEIQKMDIKASFEQMIKRI